MGRWIGDRGGVVESSKGRSSGCRPVRRVGRAAAGRPTIAAISSVGRKVLRTKPSAPLVEAPALERVRPAHGQDADVGTVGTEPGDEGHARHRPRAGADRRRRRRAGDRPRGRAPGRPGRRCRRPCTRPPMASSPVRLSRTRSSASTTRTRSGPSDRGLGWDMAPMVRPRRGRRESDLRRRPPRRERRVAATSSVADRRRLRGGAGARRHRRPTRPRAARATSGPIVDLDRRALAGLARARERAPRPARRGRACRPARGGRRARVAGSNPLPSSSTRSRTPPRRAGGPRPGPGGPRRA